jgi:hypothetical protein
VPAISTGSTTLKRCLGSRIIYKHVVHKRLWLKLSLENQEIGREHANFTMVVTSHCRKLIFP